MDQAPLVVRAMYARAITTTILAVQRNYRTLIYALRKAARAEWLSE